MLIWFYLNNKGGVNLVDSQLLHVRAVYLLTAMRVRMAKADGYGTLSLSGTTMTVAEAVIFMKLGVITSWRYIVMAI